MQKCCHLFLLFFFVGTLGHAEEVAPRSVSSFFDDGRYLLTAPSRITKENRKWSYMAAGAILGTAIFDEEFYDHYFPLRRTDPSTDLKQFGDRVQTAIPLMGTGFLIQGIFAHNEKSKETAYLTYESFIWGAATCGIIKLSIGRKRPYTTPDSPFNFKPFGRDSSFPSGHTMEAFAAATVVTEQYPHWAVAIPAYGVAAATGISRMAANQHWASDVVAGAMLGAAIAHGLRHRHRRTGEYTWDISTTGSDLKLAYHF